MGLIFVITLIRTNSNKVVVRKTRVEKAIKIVLEKGVKLHLFKPSNREIWTVVGKDNEYWVDPENSFCSCKDYYFQTLSGKERCYHLQVIEEARERKLMEVIVFSDEDYTTFLKALINDIFLSVAR
jgi:predicted nucleic acid-binding Zn finger protein